MPRLLVVDDDTVTCRLLADVFKRDGYTVIGETDPRRALARVADEPVELAILDVQMPEMDGLALLRGLLERLPGLPVVIMTAFGSIDTAVQAIASGAVDYLSKPMDVEEIRATVRKALGRSAEAQAALPVAGEELGGVVGRSPAMVEVYKTIARVAPGRSTVLILGESGTGKELVARAIHANSPRRKRPFVAVDCGALTETLLESELFGHVRGAFTDAHAARKGLFVQASGGALFLDEIGDLPLALQAKLLRALQTRSVRPVGANDEVPFDVNLIAATNRDLESAVEEGRFREDLYFRINVIHVEMPPLRARGGDVLLLAQHFVDRYAAQAGKRVTGLSPEAAERLLAYVWPGNVRELENCIERAIALTRHETIGLDDLPEKIRGFQRSHVLVAGDDPSELAPLEEVERRYVLRVMEAVGGSKTLAARVLGIGRKTLYRKLEQYKIGAVSRST